MKKQRNSRQRQLIFDTVMEHCDHPTADDIYLEVRAKDEKISRGTVGLRESLTGGLWSGV